MSVSHLPINSKGQSIASIDAPQEPDRRFVFVNSPSREGSYTWLCSKGDDLNPTPPASGRGDGPQALLSFTEPDTLEIEIPFCEAIQLHSGHVSWRPVDSWGFEDSWNLLVRLTATTVIPNGSNEGNCNLVATGLGFNVIVPAAGDGAYDVDLDAAIPVPDGYSSVIDSGTGYWDVDKFWSEEVTPNYQGKGEFNFYDTSLEFFFCKNMDCGNPSGSWDLLSYKAEWVSSRWTAVFKATKVSSGAGKIGGYFMLFRPGAT